MADYQYFQYIRASRVNFLLQIGESIITDDCQELLTCLDTGIVNIESISCKSDEVCRVQNGVRGCYPKQCVLETGGSFTIFNGTTWTISSNGAFDLVKICDGANTVNWFRVVVELQACNTGALKPAAIYVFFGDVLITVNSKHEIWVSKKSIVTYTEYNQIFALTILLNKLNVFFFLNI